MEQITDITNNYIRPSFTESELYSKSEDAPDIHLLSSVTLNGLQAIREFIDVPLRVTSSYRTVLGNVLAGGGSASHHLGASQPDSDYLGSYAVDFQAWYTQDRGALQQGFYNQMMCKGPLYQQLKVIGIKGIGIYKTFIHIDDGNSPYNPRTQMTFWDQSEGEFGPYEITTAYMNTVPEEGNPECDDQIPNEPSEEFIQFQSEKKNWWQKLFQSTEEDGIAFNSYQIAGIVVSLSVLAFIVFKVYSKVK